MKEFHKAGQDFHDMVAKTNQLCGFHRFFSMVGSYFREHCSINQFL